MAVLNIQKRKIFKRRRDGQVAQSGSSTSSVYSSGNGGSFDTSLLAPYALRSELHSHANKAMLDLLAMDGVYLKYDGNGLHVENADNLGGRAAADYYHKDNANKDDVDWTAYNLYAFAAILQDYLHLGKGFVTQAYQSGFDGHGAKLNTEDPENSTLEIDKLVVRKDMKIHELIIKKIRNVGGSLLVTNGSEADSADDLGETASLFFDGVWSNNASAIVTFTDLWQ